MESLTYSTKTIPYFFLSSKSPWGGGEGATFNSKVRKEGTNETRLI